MIKILVDYDTNTGEIRDGALLIANYVGLDHLQHKEEDKKTKVDELIALKKAGFDASEIIELKQSKLIG